MNFSVTKLAKILYILSKVSISLTPGISYSRPLQLVLFSVRISVQVCLKLLLIFACRIFSKIVGILFRFLIERTPRLKTSSVSLAASAKSKTT